METRANYVIVGIFTLLAILSAFAFVYWTAAIGERGETALLRVRIPGSAAGLARGSAVLFNGVKVGDVRRVFIDVQNPTVAIADTEIDRLTPITKSTQADIGIAGLTGQANIELKGGNPQEVNLFDEAEANGKVAEITANPSAVTNLLQTAQALFKRADNVLSQVEVFVGEVHEPLTRTVNNAEKFSEALGRNAEGVDKFLANVSKLSETLGGVSGKIEGTLTAVDDLLKSVNKDKVSEIVTNLQKFTSNLNENTKDLDKIIAGVQKAVGNINGFAEKGSDTLTKADGILSAVNPESLRTTLGNFQDASRDAKTAASDVAKVTEKFGNRSHDIDRMISDATELAHRLNAASVRIDGILTRVDQLLGSGQANGLMSEATGTLKAFRQVADTLNARLDTILNGIQQFTGPGLRDVEAFVRDGRRSINRIEQAITDLERNPQRIITGGEGTVREYDGRARR
ncbi:phospholipid/cholesterol/gamma-HCH transport system substrate-binding protein [Mesorhizobium soli]|jgi:phospholipid/cholesterol/gamma-HCH transport system substrate-binding protein|uniref:MlaD family protein n=1 Tax=Pseudaminobacter soli (ex Li et al. 2025) TaxID=1295366 RepID=UPI002474657A|nr:MlaD family protein [Mesorhizobium soli]MDH6232790.1 phospholipid/cholesterol/gamma-HCH transport system substrate-binding protein [Mesorhizobium soli]